MIQNNCQHMQPSALSDPHSFNGTSIKQILSIEAVPTVCGGDQFGVIIYSNSQCLQGGQSKSITPMPPRSGRVAQSGSMSCEDNLLWALVKRFRSPEQKPRMLWCLGETSGTTVAM